MKLALGCDHGGFELKEAVRSYCEERQIPYEDFGAYSTESVDYAPCCKQARMYLWPGGFRGADLFHGDWHFYGCQQSQGRSGGPLHE